MNDVKIFEHPMFDKLPVLAIEGVEWFGATEAAKALNFGNPYDAIKNHVEEDDLAVHEVIDKLGRNQQKNFINESGLYSLIFGAAKQGNNPGIKEKAKQFKRWVTSEVLPSIRKHGAYMTADTLDSLISDPDFGIKLLTTLKEEKEKRQKAEQAALQANLVIEQQKPKVLIAESIEASKDSILVREFAIILKQNGVDIGEKRLFAWLRKNGYLVSRAGTDNNTPTQRSMELGLFELKETPYPRKNGEMGIGKTPKITGKGQAYFIKKFLSGKEGMA